MINKAKDHEYNSWRENAKENIYFNQDIKQRILIDNPETIVVKPRILSNVGLKGIENWMHRKTDTSIALDQRYHFHSSGTSINFFDAAVINTNTHDICINENGSAKLLESSHHNWNSYSWILYRNNIKNLKKYCMFLNQSAGSFETRKKYTFMINSRWSAHNFYHWFHECIPRLMAFQDQFRESDNIEMIWGGGIKPSKYHIESLQAIGIDVTKIKYVEGVITAKNVITTTFVHANSFHRKQSIVASKVFSMCTGNKNNKWGEIVMIMRKRSGARYIVNEAEVNNYAIAHNIFQVYLEDLSLSDQKNLFARAKIVIAVHGAGLTHVLNMRKGTSLIEIMPSDSIHPLYWYLSSIQEVDYSCIVTNVVNQQQGLKLNMLELDDHVEAHKWK